MIVGRRAAFVLSPGAASVNGRAGAVDVVGEQARRRKFATIIEDCQYLFVVGKNGT